MRGIEFSGRLRRANERVSEYQNSLPIAALWGDGAKGSADVMAMDASRHLIGHELAEPVSETALGSESDDLSRNRSGRSLDARP
ncbi:Tn3 family transposase [Variovorax sp. J22R115]|uniref:Tn3 family transposase n=1 Tax=Variovorax sp. J22R115 TaxID=3053509 RepID=UPI0034DFC5F6